MLPLVRQRENYELENKELLISSEVVSKAARTRGDDEEIKIEMLEDKDGLERK